MLTEVFICDAIRTPIGRFGGALSSVRADDLAAIPIRALLARNLGVASAVDEVVLGCANQAGEDNRNVARMAGLLAGLPEMTPAVTVNRLCASGLDAIGAAYRAIRCGETSVVIAGGVESMTRAPLVMAKAEVAFQRSVQVYDTTIGWRFVNPQMMTQFGIDSMPETAENVARECGIAREDQDAFAVRSQERAGRAQEAGLLAEEIVQVHFTSGKREHVVGIDEHPRPGTTIENLQALKPIVAPDGTVTAGNSSGVNDGAAAVLLASSEAVERHSFNPIARIVGFASAGVAPRLMGLGPVPAVRGLAERIGVSIFDFDVIELNEAFASQAIASLRQLGLPDAAEHVNPNGGAIALGHPLGMSGARLTGALIRHLKRSGGRFGLATMCVGVGQGVALAVERV